MAFNLRYVDYPASPDREFPCDLCALSFDRQHDLKRHIETHSGEKPYLCDRGCGKAFTRKDALKRHQTSFPFCPPVRGPPPGVSGMVPHPPAHTHPQSMGVAQPAYHAGTHPSSKYGVGLPAPASYSTGRSPGPQYASHYPTPATHPSSKYGPTPAPYSTGYPPAPPNVSHHGSSNSLASHHASGLPSPVKYEAYGTGLPPVSHYSQPFLPQPSSGGDYPASPYRPFPCDVCALSFDRHHDLKRHKGTHVGERPYTCNGGCEKTFTRKDALKRHQLSKECGRFDS